MAGNYPDAPNVRFPYSRITGLTVVNIASGSPVVMTQAHIDLTDAETGNRTFHADTSSSNYRTAARWVFLFNEPMNITHFFWLSPYSNGVGTAGSHPLESSVNTTNGIDGTWNTIAAGAFGSQHTYGATSMGNYRTIGAGGIYTIASNGTGLRGLRFGIASGGATTGYLLGPVHLYGRVTSPTDRLRLWHPTLDQPLSDTPAFLDFGDVPQSTSTDRNFRVKNDSALTATTITVGMDARTDGSPTLVSQHTFSYNGGSFGSTASLASLAPGIISETFTIRQSLLPNAPLGVWHQRLYVTAASWT